MQILETPIPRIQMTTVTEAAKQHHGPNRKARRAAAKAKRIADKTGRQAGRV